MPAKTITFDVVREIALELPGIESSTIHGAPSLKVGGKLFACPAIHRSTEPNTIVVRIDRAERAKLVKSEPGIYYVTDHYQNFPMVLVRLSQIGRRSLRNLLGKALVAASPQTKTTGKRAPGQRRRRSG
jgi:hypothetical protein